MGWQSAGSLLLSLNLCPQEAQPGEGKPSGLSFRPTGRALALCLQSHWLLGWLLAECHYSLNWL